MNNIKQRLIDALAAYVQSGVPSRLADAVQSCINDIHNTPKKKAVKRKPDELEMLSSPKLSKKKKKASKT